MNETENKVEETINGEFETNNRDYYDTEIITNDNIKECDIKEEDER